MWLCLGALCVIDEHHAEVLSSGQWMGQDGKPRTKVCRTFKLENLLQYNHFILDTLCSYQKVSWFQESIHTNTNVL